MAPGAPPPPRPPDPSLTLDREDHEGYAEAIRRQWGALAYLLGIRFRVEDLNAPNAAVVIGNIVNHMATTRGAIASVPNLQALLTQSYQTELTEAEQAIQPNTVANVATQEGLPIAKALIEVVNRHFEREDIRGLMDDIPSAIRPVTTSRRWTGTADLGGTVTTIGIDVADRVWRQGDEAAIRQKVVGRRPSEVAIDTVPPYNNALTDQDVTNILNSTCNIISQRIPLWDVHIPDVPIVGQQTVVDVSGLLRQNPLLANMNAPALVAYFSVARPENIHFRVFTNAGAPVGLGIPMPNAMVTALFGRLNRTGRTLAQETSNLSDAVRNRSSVDRLIASNASNRELLIALATIRQDPTAADAISAGNPEAQRIQGDLDRASRLLAIAMSVKSLKEGKLPVYNEAGINDGRTAMDQVSLNAEGGRSIGTPPPGTNVNLRAGLSPAQNAQANAARLPGSLNRIYRHAPPPILDNWDQFQRVIDKCNETLGKYDEAEQQLDVVCRTLEEFVTALTERGVNPATIRASYPILNRYLVVPPPPAAAFAVQRGQVDRSLNVALLENEFKRALRDLPANAADRVALQDASVYERQVQDLSTRHAEALTKGGGAIEGSKSCWDVIRRGLENQRHPPLSQEEIESTFQAFRAQVQLSRELRQDINLFQERDVPVGTGEQDAAGRWRQDHEAEAWDQSRSYRNLRTLGIRGSPSALNEYTTNLFQPGRIGLPLNADPRQRQFRIPTLIDAYRTTKYLLERAPEPYRLPNSERYQLFVRRLHGAILERAFLSFERASSMNPAEMGALRGAGVSDTMSADERLQAVRSFLIDGAQEYEKSRGPIIEAMAKTCYRPIQRRIDSHNWWKKVVGGTIGGTVGGTGTFIVNRANNIFTGNGSRLNPLTWPARTVQTGVAVAKASAAPVGWGVVGAAVPVGLTVLSGAAIATALPLVPIAAAAGLGYGIYRKFFNKKK